MRALLIFLSLALGSWSLAAEIVPPDPWEVIHAAREFGTAEVGRDTLSEPRIVGAFAEHEDDPEIAYEINFYGCELARNCKTILFRASLHHGDWEKKPPHLDLFDAWNRRKLIGRAFWSLDGRAVLEHPVAMSAGLPKETLVATFLAWKTALQDYGEFLDFPGS
ncbi:MAG: YbjN domain-containing protein [Pseudomonadota bacterium]